VDPPARALAIGGHIRPQSPRQIPPSPALSQRQPRITSGSLCVRTREIWHIYAPTDAPHRAVRRMKLVKPDGRPLKGHTATPEGIAVR